MIDEILVTPPALPLPLLPSPLRFRSFLLPPPLFFPSDCDRSVMTNETAKPKPKNSEATKERKDLDIIFLYYSQYHTPPDTDPLMWWKPHHLLHHQEFCPLVRMARQYLVHLTATSSFSWQLFSRVGLARTDFKRRRGVSVCTPP